MGDTASKGCCGVTSRRLLSSGWQVMSEPLTRKVVELRVKASADDFFSNLIFILYWSILDLQCCVSFRCTAK